jgi:5,10-methylene-tetrahydrofolate dehydrogenase/methenyl tetrahydrofolate cyclohydrolase
VKQGNITIALEGEDTRKRESVQGVIVVTPIIKSIGRGGSITTIGPKHDILNAVAGD